MCSPKPPKPPKLQEIDRYSSYREHPAYDEFIKQTGTANFGSEKDVQNFQRWQNRREFDAARNDETFVKAERQLRSEGTLQGLKDIRFDNDKAQRFKRRYDKGDSGIDWKTAYQNERFDYSYQGDLQKVYDRVYEIEQNEYDREYNKGLRQSAREFQKSSRQTTRQQTKMYRESMKDMAIQTRKTNKDNREFQKRMMKQSRIDGRKSMKNQRQMQRKQLKAQEKLQRQADKRQQEMMEEMMNQPIYQPRQAALPKMQEQARTPDPAPVAPAPPPQMNISPAPVPELVNSGNPMAIIRQSNTARTRARQRTRGTSSLT